MICELIASTNEEPPEFESGKPMVPSVVPKLEPFIVNTVCVPAVAVAGEKEEIVGVALGAKLVFVVVGRACTT